VITRTLEAILSIAIALIGTLAQANAQTASLPALPDAIKAPAGEQIVLVAHASGVQIYTCEENNRNYAWTLKAPDAVLHDSHGAVIGRHFAGPTWKLKDGSEVKGKLAAKANSPDSDSIPWLLVTATEHTGTGRLSAVSSIQRIHTKGGEPPPAAGCNASTANHEAKSSYTADYYFYAPTK